MKMETAQKILLPVIIILIVVSFVFIGFELGKHYSARNIVTQAVASIDPFVYCSIHDSFNVTKVEITNLEDYAVQLYIMMSVESIQDIEDIPEEMTDIMIDIE